MTGEEAVIRVLTCSGAGRAQRRLGGASAGHAPRAARPRCRAPGQLAIHAPGGLIAALPLRPGQLQRVRQQPHGVEARRPHPAALKVAHGALAQPGAGR